ncbi:MAG TPA: hypothetical protein VLJ86_02585, partial [Ramlibacter sp.]|nr:hypothetical protein [Ramlibacter sp.]
QLAARLSTEKADSKAELRGKAGVLWVKEKASFATFASTRTAHREAAHTLVREAVVSSLRDMGARDPAFTPDVLRTVTQNLMRLVSLRSELVPESMSKSNAKRDNYVNVLYVQNLQSVLDRAASLHAASLNAGGKMTVDAAVSQATSIFFDPSLDAPPQEDAVQIATQGEFTTLRPASESPVGAGNTTSMPPGAQQLPPGPPPTPPGPPETPIEPAQAAAVPQAPAENWNKDRKPALVGRDALFATMPRAEFWPDDKTTGEQSAHERLEDWTSQGVDLRLDRRATGSAAPPQATALSRPALLKASQDVVAGNSVNVNWLAASSPAAVARFLKNCAEQAAT